MRMTAAYSMFANGGRRIKPTLIDRIQDRTGQTIYRHDDRKCDGCDADKWNDQAEPKLIDNREQVLDPLTAYQITSMLEGVVQRGTGAGRSRPSASRWRARPAPRTTPRTCGSSASRPTSRSACSSATTSRVRSARRRTAAPVRRAGLPRLHADGLKDKPATPFRVPPGIKLIRDHRRDRHARRFRRQRRGDPGSVQARNGSARLLFGGGRRRGRSRPAWRRKPTGPSERDRAACTDRGSSEPGTAGSAPARRPFRPAPPTNHPAGLSREGHAMRPALSRSSWAPL